MHYDITTTDQEVEPLADRVLNMAAHRYPLWSRRGLRFIQILLQSLADGDRDENNPNLIRVNITKAYEQALKRYHGWIVQKVFQVRSQTTHFPIRCLITTLTATVQFL